MLHDFVVNVRAAHVDPAAPPPRCLPNWRSRRRHVCATRRASACAGRRVWPASIDLGRARLRLSWSRP